MLKRVLFSLALATAPLLAQTTPSPNLAGIAHVALRVKDLDASVAFYQKLGFLKAFDLSRDGKVYEAFIKINDHQFIELYPVDVKNPQPGFLHVCFEGNDLNALHDYYVAQGLHPIDVRKAGAGNLLFTMPGPMTPQGPQNMEYTQYMPGSLHSKDFGQHLGPDRISNELTQVFLAVDDPVAARSFYEQKTGFPASSAQTKGSGSNLMTGLALPGAGTERVVLTPSAELGLKTRFFLSVDTLPDLEVLRRHRKLSPTEVVGDGLMVDPDGNQIFLQLKTLPTN